MAQPLKKDMTAEEAALYLKGLNSQRKKKKKKSTKPAAKAQGLESGIKSNAESLSRQHRIAKNVERHSGDFKVHKSDLDRIKKKFQ
jgi:hypothetical protein